MYCPKYYFNLFLTKNGMNSLSIEVEIPKVENVTVTDKTLSVE